jgi:hypothetical protein
MIIDPWTKYLKDKARKKQAKAWRKKKGLTKPSENKKPKKKKSKPKDAGKFYKSWEWKQIRYEVLRERGNRCELCGVSPSDTFHGYLVVDHIQSVRKHPEKRLDKSNLQILCNDCNMGKSDKYHDDWRPETATPANHADIKEWLDE